MPDLTPRQAQVLDLVRDEYRTAYGIANELGCHPTNARTLLTALQDRGFVKARPVHSETRGRPKLEYRGTGPAGRPARVQAALETATQHHPDFVRILAGDPFLGIEDTFMPSGSRGSNNPDEHTFKAEARRSRGRHS